LTQCEQPSLSDHARVTIAEVFDMSKPMEALSMLKEAAGTRRLYDMRMEAALKTLETSKLRWMSWTINLARFRVLPLSSCERSC
jgi:hypothetical protein